MCGIFGFFLNRPLNEDDLTRGREGARALAHRGPDGEGEWYDRQAGAYLGHRRLSIIDLSERSAQPMRREQHVLAYNGAIYNYRSLRDRLTGLGAKFSSDGDTEVLLRAWQQFGRYCLDHLDGMFAFALWDGESAWLATDHFGEKQLYVAETGDGVYISSELGPLVRLLKPKLDLSPAALTPFYALGYVPAPGTSYIGVKHLPPATLIRISQGRLGPFETYWRPQLPEPGRGRIRKLSEHELDRVGDALIESVNGRLEADVPTCIFLSSGVDSSLIAAITARELQRDLPCLTVSFPRGRVVDEGESAGRIAKHLGLKHTILKSRDNPDEIDAAYLFVLFGQLNENMTVASVEQMALAATDSGFKVGLSGIGGDEIFFGYKKLAFFYKYRRLYNAPQLLRLLAAHMTAPARFIHSKLSIYRNLFAVDQSERFLALKNQPAIAGLRTLSGYDAWLRQAFPETGRSMEIEGAYIDLVDTMVNSQLPTFDLGSMRASHELRTPFLNRKLLASLADMDARVFFSSGQKTVLRRLLRRYLPNDLLDKRKMGFRFPAELLTVDYRKPVRCPGLPDATAAQAWANADEPGWQRLKLRGILAHEFSAWHDAAITSPN